MTSLTAKKVLAVSPVHDALTAVFDRWLKEVTASRGHIEHLSGAIATRTNVVGWLGKHNTLDVMLMFWGHGAPDALLTSPTGDQHSRLLDSSVLPSGGDLQIVAFCCFAASDLGRLVRQRGHGNRFLGCVDELVFLFGTAARERAFLEPMRLVAEEVLDSGEVEAPAATRLISLFRTEARAWEDGRQQDPRGFLMAMFLLEDSRAVCPEV